MEELVYKQDWSADRPVLRILLTDLSSRRYFPVLVIPLAKYRPLRSPELSVAAMGNSVGKASTFFGQVPGRFLHFD